MESATNRQAAAHVPPDTNADLTISSPPQSGPDDAVVDASDPISTYTKIKLSSTQSSHGRRSRSVSPNDSTAAVSVHTPIANTSQLPLRQDTPHAPATAPAQSNVDAIRPLLDSSAGPRSSSTLRFSGQTSTQNTRLPRRPGSLAALTEKVKYSFTPSRHNSSDPYATRTAREFNQVRQLRRILRLTIGECLLTFIFCGTYAGILVYYNNVHYLDNGQRHRFNALITGISYLIGVNLTASLRSYAKVLRWRLLAYCYRPLETFDLVLGCDSLWNVLKLVFKARNRQHKYSPSWTQLLGTLWLLLHLSLTIFVSMISLNFGLNIGEQTTITHAGSATMVDLDDVLGSDFPRSLSTIQSFGASYWSLQQYYGLGYDGSSANTFNDADNGTTEYYFQLHNAGGTALILSHYHIQTTAFCSSYNVTEGIYGDETWLVYTDRDGKHVNQTYEGYPVGPAGSVVMSNANSTCGPRCTQINVFQAAASGDPDDPNYVADFSADYAVFFTCNNTMTPVLSSVGVAPQDVQFKDLTARMLAGAMGWSDTPRPDSTWYTQSYPWESQVGWVAVLESTELAAYLAGYTMKTIVGMATSYNYLDTKTVTVQDAPVQSQYIDITWKYVIALLAGIPGAHLLTLIIVLALANNTIIKDDSHLAMAKLYTRLLKDNGLENRGCMLEDDEIIDHIGNPMVTYGWVETDDLDEKGRRIAHVDVFEHGAGCPDATTPFKKDIYYDGGTTSRRVPMVEHYRDFDAKEWF